MEIQYQYTADDFAEAQIAAARLLPQLRRAQMLPLLIGLLILLALPVALLTGGHISYSDPRLWIMPAFGLYLVLGSTVLRPVLLRRRFRRIPHLAGGHSTSFSEEAFQIAGPEGRSEMVWSAVDRYAESKNVFVLVRLPSIIYLFPKRAFTSAQLDEFRELLSRKLPKK